jgi:hypothetical protein
MANPGKYVVDAIASVADTPQILGVTVAKARRIADWVAGAFQETLTPGAKRARRGRSRVPRSAAKHPAAKKAKQGANRARASAAKTTKRASRAPSNSKKVAKKKTAKRAGRAAKKK